MVSIVRTFVNQLQKELSENAELWLFYIMLLLVIDVVQEVGTLSQMNAAATILAVSIITFAGLRRGSEDNSATDPQAELN